jgi:hypothetical protein
MDSQILIKILNTKGPEVDNCGPPDCMVREEMVPKRRSEAWLLVK